MNTLKITKGEDVKISVNYDELYFVTDFSAKEVTDFYKIEEMLSQNVVDYLKMKTAYVLTLTALSHFDSSVFDKDNFTLTINVDGLFYRYFGCRLVKKERDIKPKKAITDKYTLIASQMRVMEV